MKRRKWDAKMKTRIVLQGPKGKAVAELCNGTQKISNFIVCKSSRTLRTAHLDPAGLASCVLKPSTVFRAPKNLGSRLPMPRSESHNCFLGWVP